MHAIARAASASNAPMPVKNSLRLLDFGAAE